MRRRSGLRGGQRPQPSPYIREGFGRDGVTRHRVVSIGSRAPAGKAVGGCASLARGVFGVTMPEIILDEAQNVATVRQGTAAAMAQHVGMDVKRQVGPRPADADQVVDRKAHELITAFRQKEPRQL